MSDQIHRSRVIWGRPGFSSGFVTTPELTAAVADRAPSTPTFITRTAEAGLSNAFALNSIGPGLLKVGNHDGALGIASGADVPAHSHTGVAVSAGWLIDGGGAVITTGVKGDLPPMAFAGNIVGYCLLPDQSGSMAVGLWKDAMGNFPPVAGDSVLTITLTAAAKLPATGNYQEITPIPFVVGDVFRFNVNSASTIQRATVGLLLERTI